MTLTGGTCPAGSLDSRLRQVPVVRSVLGPSRISGAGRSFQRRRTHRIIVDRPATGSRRQSAGHMHRDCDFRTCRSGVLLTLELPDRVGGFVGCDSNSGVHWPPVVIPAEKLGSPGLACGIRVLQAALLVTASLRGYLRGVLEFFQRLPGDLW